MNNYNLFSSLIYNVLNKKDCKAVLQEIFKLDAPFVSKLKNIDIVQALEKINENSDYEATIRFTVGHYGEEEEDFSNYISQKKIEGDFFEECIKVIRNENKHFIIQKGNEKAIIF